MSSYTINTVCLAGGRLTKDAVLKYTNSGSAVVTFSVAVGRSVKVRDSWEEETDFFKIVYWGKQAEAAHKYSSREDVLRSMAVFRRTNGQIERQEKTEALSRS